LEKHYITVKAEDDGLRLDRIIAKHLKQFSRIRIRGIIGQGAVYINNRRTKLNAKAVHSGDTVAVYADANVKKAPMPSGGLEILYEDEEFLAVNKPAGVASDETRTGDIPTLVDLLRAKYGAGAYFQPVHRLDLGASGVMLVSRRRSMTSKLMQMLQKHEISKMYRAWVSGLVAEDEGRFESRLITDPKDPRKTKSSPQEGKLAVTIYRVLQRDEANDRTLVEVDLVTGRHHQIRVHFSEAGHPVLGDWLYGVAGSAERLMLHAHTVKFVHPATGETIVVEAASELE
jgi:23S rRNA pseudouridine1911/1915/1917 synthase